MKWINEIGFFEKAITLLFLLSYLAYFIQTLQLSKRYSFNINDFLKKFILRTIYFALLVGAIIGITFGNVKKEIPITGKDIFIVFDVSSSMNAKDVAPSRIMLTKNTVQQTLQQLSSNDKIGLITFSGDAEVLCPLTYDKSAVNLFVESIHNFGSYSNGSSIGEALLLALKQLKKETSSGKFPNKQLVLLITDGENFDNKLNEATSSFRANKIPIFILGAGTTEGGYVPTLNGLKKSNKGQPVVSKLDSKMMIKLANQTNGNFYLATNNSSLANKISKDINNYKGAFREYKTLNVASNKYLYLLVIALVLIVIDGLWTVRIINV